MYIYHDLHTSILSMTYTHPWLHMMRATFFHEGYVKTVRHISVAACQSRSKPRALWQRDKAAQTHSGLCMFCSVAEPRAKEGLLPRRAFCDVAYDSNTHNAFLKRFPGFSIRWFSYCLRNFWVSKSSRICCSVADMSSALFSCCP